MRLILRYEKFIYAPDVKPIMWFFQNSSMNYNYKLNI